jgi:sarcosine oxidase subunit gamma
MSELPAIPAFQGLSPVGEGGGVTVRLRDLSVVSVLARKDRGASLAQKMLSEFALELPDGPRRSAAGGLSVLGVGPGRWFCLRDRSGPEFAAELQAALGSMASISDHSDGYAVFEIKGPATLKVLAKGVPLDLHPSVFAADSVAVTVIAHIGATVWRCNGSFMIAVFRSYAGSFWHWLSASAAEFGLDTVKTP